jgi:hypothetical protein
MAYSRCLGFCGKKGEKAREARTQKTKLSNTMTLKSFGRGVGIRVWAHGSKNWPQSLKKLFRVPGIPFPALQLSLCCQTWCVHLDPCLWMASPAVVRTGGAGTQREHQKHHWAASRPCWGRTWFGEEARQTTMWLLKEYFTAWRRGGWIRLQWGDSRVGAIWAGENKGRDRATMNTRSRLETEVQRTMTTGSLLSFSLQVLLYITGSYKSLMRCLLF